MTARIALSVLIATLLTGVSTSAQSPGGQAPLAGRFVDPANGLSLEHWAPFSPRPCLFLWQCLMQQA